MSGETKTICVDCGEVVLWEQLYGMRLVRIVDGKKSIQTKCGCGDIARTPNGAKVKP